MKRFLSLTAAALLLVSLSTACEKAKEPADDTTTAVTTAATTEQSKNYNVLTGLNDMEEGIPTRPVGIMVPNDSLTIGNQAGIDKADMYMECETEGGIPRMMALFSSTTRIPAKFGPVRSARSPFVNVARSFGLLFCHAGQSGPAKKILNTGVLDHFDALADSNTFWRDSELKAKMDYVHSVATSGEKLTAKLEKSNYEKNVVKTDLPFQFGQKTGTTPANKVQMNSTVSSRVTFIYDSSTGLYGKNTGKIDSCKKHLSLEGQQITVTNVVALFGEKYVDATYNGTIVYNFRTGSGKGYVLTGGTTRPITFTIGDGTMTIKESDGTKLTLNPGKTYWCIVDQNTYDNVIVQ